MRNPVAKAKWVLETKGITGTPAESLHQIALSEGIRYKYCRLPNDPQLSGELLYMGDKKGIIINTWIDNPGRHHFTFAHELGHYFLNHPPSSILDGQTGFWCSLQDRENEQNPYEREANQFAVELLMPELSFRLDMAGSPIDFDLIGSLAKKYKVSKHACSNRILQFTHTPVIIITCNQFRVQTLQYSRTAATYIKPLTQIPGGTLARKIITNHLLQRNFQPANPTHWLKREPAVGTLYECTHGDFTTGRYMIILQW